MYVAAGIVKFAFMVVDVVDFWVVRDAILKVVVLDDDLVIRWTEVIVDDEDVGAAFMVVYGVNFKVEFGIFFWLGIILDLLLLVVLLLLFADVAALTAVTAFVVTVVVVAFDGILT